MMKKNKHLSVLQLLQAQHAEFIESFDIEKREASKIFSFLNKSKISLFTLFNFENVKLIEEFVFGDLDIRDYLFSLDALVRLEGISPVLLTHEIKQWVLADIERLRPAVAEHEIHYRLNNVAFDTFVVDQIALLLIIKEIKHGKQ